jgi:hypothetical protein
MAATPPNAFSREADKQPLWQEDHDRHQDRAEDQHLVVLEHHQHLRQQGQHQRAEHRTVGRGETAEDHHGDDLDREEEIERHHGDDLDREEEIERHRADEILLVREQAAGQRGHAGREHEYLALDPRGVDAEGLRGDLRAVHPGARIDEVQRQQHRGEHHHRHHRVPAQVAVDGPAEQRQSGDAGHAVGTAGPVDRLDHDDVDDDAEAERGHRQVVTLELEQRPRDQRGDHEDDRQADRHRRPRIPAVAGRQDRRGVRAHAEERRVAERDLPGETDEQVERDGEHHVEANGDTDHGDEVVVREQHRQQCDDHRQRQETTQPAQRAHTRSAALRPNSPLGRRISTSSTTVKASASL